MLHHGWTLKTKIFSEGIYVVFTGTVPLMCKICFLHSFSVFLDTPLPIFLMNAVVSIYIMVSRSSWVLVQEEVEEGVVWTNSYVVFSCLWQKDGEVFLRYFVCGNDELHVTCSLLNHYKYSLIECGRLYLFEGEYEFTMQRIWFSDGLM